MSAPVRAAQGEDAGWPGLRCAACLTRAGAHQMLCARAVMRFAPVEVITRYYQQPIVASKDPASPSRSGSPIAGRRGSGPPSPTRGALGYPGAALESTERWLGEQAYEHDFEVSSCLAYRL